MEIKLARLPMSHLVDTELIRDFFADGGIRLVLTSSDVPPVILLPTVIFCFEFHEFDDQADSELLVNILSEPGVSSTKIKAPSYLSLLCNHFQCPIKVTFHGVNFSLIAVSVEEYNRRAKTEWKLSEERMQEIAAANLRDLAAENE